VGSISKVACVYNKDDGTVFLYMRYKCCKIRSCF